MLRLSVTLLFALLVIVSGENTQQSGTTATTTKTSVTSLPSTTPSTPTKVLIAAEPPIGKWNYTENNHTCIMVQFAAEIKINYETSDHKMNETMFIVPANNTNVQGTCQTNNQNITIMWQSKMDQMNGIMLSFMSANNSEVYNLDDVEVMVNALDLPNSNENGTLTYVHKHKQYPTKKDKSYRCTQVQTMNLMRNNKTAGYIKISHLQFQAFMTSNADHFGLAQDCPFDTPDYVPITVGCALAGLVVIVLIAYLVGRRRNQAQGYLSM